MRRGYGLVPAASYSKVVFLRDDMHQPAVLSRKALKNLRRAVKGMIVNHNHIVAEVCLLGQRAPDCIGDRPCPVPDRNHHGHFHGILPCIRRHRPEGRLKICPHPFQGIGAYFLHLNLDIPVLRIHIIELLPAGGTKVGLHSLIYIFVYMYYILHSETKVVQRPIASRRFH